MTNLPYVKKPCKDCPFKKDALKGWLGKERIEEILKRGSFVCHKKRHLQCAGHMLLKGEGNDFVQLASRLKIPVSLEGRELVFESEEDCVDHHSKQDD